jgi:carotenoid cleavage dioxygenase-like enzyme
LEPGSFLGEWSQSAGWDFDIATSLSPDFNNIPRTLLWRYRINARTGTVFREPAPGCEDLCIDHPHVNPMFEGRRECRYVYASISNEVRCSGPPLGYVRIDVATGKTQRWWAGNRTFCEEVVLVPKKGSDGSPGSDDKCWVLGMCVAHDAEGAGRSSLVVLDGEDLGKGPVARVWLDNQIPHGLHGMFVPA